MRQDAVVRPFGETEVVELGLEQHREAKREHRNQWLAERRRQHHQRVERSVKRPVELIG